MTDTPNIDQSRRPLERLLKKFVDGYEWWVDEAENHRLIHPPTDSASIWVLHNSMAVLHDKFVLSTFWLGVLPTETLMQWQPLRST